MFAQIPGDGFTAEAALGRPGVGEPIGRRPHAAAAAPCRYLTFERKRARDLVGILAQLREVASIRSTAPVLVRQREADDQIDPLLRHQRTHERPAAIALRYGEDGVAPLGRPLEDGGHQYV